MDEKTTLTVPAPGVLAGSSDVDGDPLTVAVTINTAHGALTLNPNGGFAYTPAIGYVGGDSFTFTASDGYGGFASATAFITSIGGRKGVAS
jgi:large repetitive protein